jgi:hypothetical protein
MSYKHHVPHMPPTVPIMLETMKSHALTILDAVPSWKWHTSSTTSLFHATGTSEKFEAIAPPLLKGIITMFWWPNTGSIFGCNWPVSPQASGKW